MMNFLIDALPIIKWVFAALFFGIVEAVMFHQCKTRNQKLVTVWEDEHIWLTIARLFVFLELFGFNNLFFFNLIGAMLVFPFLHDGAYYAMRNSLDRRLYPARFKAHSITTYARFSFEYPTRTALFVLGISVFVILFVLK
jgi:hypothetical protein